jgi:Predicted sugar phosphatases of the HAD superfamily
VEVYIEKHRDLLGVNAETLKGKKLFLFDMDGTIYEEDQVFEGTHDLLNQIKYMGGEFVFVTNNSSKSLKDYLDRINSMGIKVNEDNFFTSSQATVLYLKQNHPGKIVYCQGTKAFLDELLDASIKVVTEVTDDAEVVLVGFDTELTGQKIRNTCQMLQKDIEYIATNPDLACPVSFGFIPDCGAICNMLYHATGRKPIYIGKPEATIVNNVVKKFHCSKEDTVIIGDRLYTDIATGINAGITSICVLTGETKIEDIQNGNIKPTFTFSSVKEILNAIRD